ncbi:MAG: hypothetical protein KGL31_09415 [candidate division NC10 bacterium]|nr:hypothetical protein [candidate division NC10 bacterium]
MIANRHITTLAIAFLLSLPSASNAEYLIYLKGGHFIVADDCTFSTSQGVGKGLQASEQPIFVEDCTKGKPRSQIFWSTTNGYFGELNVDDVYAILGTKSLQPIKPSGATMPLEDYLITNRDESFVNAKVVEEKGVDIYGLKRDELAKVDRRGVIEIAPERLAKSRSGEGLCPGEPVEFAVSEVEVVDGHLIGVVTNLSKAPWRPWIDVEVSVKGRRRGKFQIGDKDGDAPLPNILVLDESTSVDQPLPARLLKELERLSEADAGVRLCYRKIKTTAELLAK